MIPAVSFAPGGKLYLIKGGIITPVNLTFVKDPEQTAPVGANNISAVSDDFYSYFWGGANSYWPCSYANHKPGAFYYGQLYQALNQIQVEGSDFVITRFDGSGVFKNAGDANYVASPWKSGRGSQLLSPSGDDNGEVRGHDMAAIVHNGVMFFVGAVFYSITAVTPGSWTKKCEWAAVKENYNGDVDRVDRTYKTFSIHYDPVTKKEKKLTTGIKTFTGDALYGDYLHACDAISFNDSIYYANWVDVLRFPGGSGVPVVVQNTALPSAKCFEVFPTSGYIGTEPSGPRSLFYLTGSGVLQRINGNIAQLTYDLAWINNDVRTTGNMARVISATAEPGRSALLLNFNRQLHAFISTATSGYHHFVCAGNPASGSSWSDLTEDLPDSFRRRDGNAFGFVDHRQNKLYVAHHTMSEVDPWGHHGAQNSAGATFVYKLDTENNWETIHETMVGEVPRGFIPYQNCGPYIAMPSGSIPTVYQASDYAVIEYYLFDHYKRPVNVTVEYSDDLGLTWNTARRFKSYTPGVGLLGSGIANLPTTPQGIKYDFYWDYVNDVGFNTVKECMVRITPSLVR